MRFSWAESMMGLFHLQMNILRLFYITFWGKSKDYYLLQQFHTILAQKRVSIKIKDFHTCDNFFRIII